METTAPENNITPVAKTGSIARIALGLLFLVPSLCCCVSQLLVPTLGTFWMSLQRIRPFRLEGEFIGLENYTRLFADRAFQSAIGFTLSVLVVQLLVVAVIPLGLAWAGSKLGRPLRLGLRILLTLPVALFVPETIAIIWRAISSPSAGVLPPGASLPLGVGNAPTTLLFIDALYLVGLAGGLGLIVYLPIWRRPADAPILTRKEIVKPALATWGVSLLGIMALTLSTFSLSFLLTGGLFGTNTLGTLLYHFAFLSAQFGPATSIATIILLAILTLGLLAGLLVLLARLRLDIVNDPPPAKEEKKDDEEKESAPKQSKTLPAIIIPAALLLLALGGCLFSALPFGWLIPHAFGPRGIGPLMDQILSTPVLGNTFIPPLITATIQVLIAYLAALSLGALQPLGKRSEWLLLLFSPWLFVTMLPLSLSWFVAIQKVGLLNTSLALISPISLSVPVLFILTIFFKGRASTENDAPAKTGFFKHFVLPSLPLVAVLWLFLLFLAWQDLFWPLIVANRLGTHPLSVMLLQLRGATGATSDTLAAAITFLVLPVCFFIFAALTSFQIFYLDRLKLYSEERAGKVEDIKSDEPVSQS